MYNNFSAPRVKAYLRATCSHAKTTLSTLQLILKIIPVYYKDFKVFMSRVVNQIQSCLVNGVFAVKCATMLYIPMGGGVVSCPPGYITDLGGLQSSEWRDEQDSRVYEVYDVMFSLIITESLFRLQSFKVSILELSLP